MLEPWVLDGRLPQPTLRCERDPRRVTHLAVGLDVLSPIPFAADLAHGPARRRCRLRCPVVDLPKHLGSVVRIPLEAAAEEELAEQRLVPGDARPQFFARPLPLYDADLAGCPVEHLILKDAGSAQARVHLHQHPGWLFEPAEA
jgi:hypothetical protein